jgi:hypothetical protein
MILRCIFNIIANSIGAGDILSSLIYVFVWTTMVFTTLDFRGSSRVKFCTEAAEV